MAKKEKETVQETVETNEQTQQADEKVTELEQSIQKKDEEITELNEKYMRLVAEYDNFKKRTVKEKEALVADAKAYAVAKLLPVIDSLERALQMNNAESSAEDLIKGIEMIYKQSLDAFDSVGAEVIEGLGEPFNPETQHAVSHIESEEFGENTVSLVMQKGYRIGDKIIRPAMVQVAN